MTPRYADVTRLLITWLSEQFPDPVRVVTDTPADITGTVRVIQVTRTGGAREHLIDNARVSISCFAPINYGDSIEAGARDLCNDVLAAMEFNLPGSVIDGQSCGRVFINSALTVRAHANPNVRGFGALCQVIVHSGT